MMSHLDRQRYPEPLLHLLTRPRSCSDNHALAPHLVAVLLVVVLVVVVVVVVVLLLVRGAGAGAGVL